MTKFENGWGIHMREGLAVFSPVPPTRHTQFLNKNVFKKIQSIWERNEK
jgi:hypothetical protein